MVDGELERQPRRVRQRRAHDPIGSARRPRCSALDGTGSIDLNREIFGEHMTAERFAVPRDAEV